MFNTTPIEDNHRTLTEPHLKYFEATQTRAAIQETLTYVSPLIKSMEVNSELQFKDVVVSLAQDRFFIQLSNNNLAFINYWNCVSIGSTATGIFLVVSDVVMNEKIDLKPELEEKLFKQEEDINKFLTNVSTGQKSNGFIEIAGNFMVNLEFGGDQELKKTLYDKLNQCSQDCPDPQELLDLQNPNSQYGQNLNLATEGINLEDFEGGEGWNKFVEQIGQKHGATDLGKREGLPLSDQFIGSDGKGGLQVFDLQAELNAIGEDEALVDHDDMQDEDDDEMDFNLNKEDFDLMFDKKNPSNR